MVSENDEVTVEAELADADAARDIAKAISKRQSVARGYVRLLRRRHPDATPADVIQMLEHHYSVLISTAGAAIAVGAIAADVGIAMIPGVGAAAAGAKSAGRQAAKRAGKEAAKAAAKQAGKSVALGAAKTTARKAAAMLPAGDEQLKFEITAAFALGVADVHGMTLDKDQAHALVYGLSNERVSQGVIATMAADLAQAASDSVVGVGQRIAAGRGDWSHWANTLADALPAGEARSLVRTIQTGQLDTVREGLNDKQQTAIEYGVGAVTGGVTRFVFGRQVIDAAQTAFGPAPDVFPAHLAVVAKPRSQDDAREGSGLRSSLRGAGTRTGLWVTDAASTVRSGVGAGASAVGKGVGTAANGVTRSLRRAHPGGDATPEEPHAAETTEGAGGVVGGVADEASRRSLKTLRRRKRSHEDPQRGADGEPGTRVPVKES